MKIQQLETKLHMQEELKIQMVHKYNIITQLQDTIVGLETKLETTIMR